MKKGLLLILLLTFSIMLTGINAESIGIFKQDTTISLHQVCNNCTFVNLTSIKFPNGTKENLDVIMTKVNFDYNTDFSRTNDLGLYFYNTCGDKNGIVVCENMDFTINRTGEELTEARTGLYILLTVLAFLLFIALLWFNIAIPYKNKENVKGDVIRIVRAKYLKIGLIPITHGAFNLSLNLLISISTNLIPGLTIYLGLFGFIFTISMALVYPVWIFCFIWFFFNWIRDFNWNDKIKKFGRAVK